MDPVGDDRPVEECMDPVRDDSPVEGCMDPVRDAKPVEGCMIRERFSPFEGYGSDEG